jgi:hypothetical protein
MAKGGRFAIVAASPSWVAVGCRHLKRQLLATYRHLGVFVFSLFCF